MSKLRFILLVVACILPSSMSWAESVTARITTQKDDIDSPYSVKVLWIEWDSSFRNSDLKIGDRIVGFYNSNVSSSPIRLDEKIVRSGGYPGGATEAYYWDKNGAMDGEAFELLVWRNGKEISIPGELRTEKFYYTPGKRPALGDNGPDRNSKDGFTGRSWMFWYEDFYKKASYVLDNAWNKNSTFNNRRELSEWIETNEERVKFLVEKHPGQFATTILADYETVRKNLEGVKVTVTPESQLWRKFGTETIRQARLAGIARAAEVRKQTPSQWVKAFPAPHPITGKLGRHIGKLIELPRVTERDLVDDLGQAYFVIGNPSDGYWIVPGKSSAMDQFFDTYFQFKSQYSAEIKMSFQFYAKVTPEPKMVQYKGRTVTALIVEPFAALAGDTNPDLESFAPGYFVDLRVPPSVPVPGRNRLRIPFAGEEKLPRPDLAPPPVSATPTQVMASLFSAIKYAKQDLWMSLFADWDFYVQPPYPPIFRPNNPFTSGTFRLAWDNARGLLTDFNDRRPDVIDVRVSHELEPVRVYPGDTARGIPPIDEVKVIVDHVIRATPDSKPEAYDGEFRVFTDMHVRRVWRLQRLGITAPWRIVELQSL